MGGMLYMSAWMIWMIVGIVLIIAEMATFTFYLLWLGIGAVVASVVAMVFPDSWFLQIIALSVVAIGLTYLTRPLTKRMIGKKGFVDAIDDLVGKPGEVVDAIEFGVTGVVRIGSETWSATADVAIRAGEKVIVERRGTTIVHVRKA
jgi:membrane protein implicated in regulation of membrane protease activity